jgi:hypothetical protein
MHLQYRIRLASGTETDAPGAEPINRVEQDPIHAETGALATLASRIADAGLNIRLVGGDGIETGGLVKIAVDDGREGDLKRVLDEHHYRYVAVEPAHDYLTDEIGALARWAEGIAKEGRLIESVSLGAPDKEGKYKDLIPIHATTIAGPEATAAASLHHERAAAR